jgi:hypothetical protein
MAGIQDFVEWYDDFLGPQTVLASPVGSDQWDLVVTGTTPTATVGGINGELTLANSSATEIQNCCVFTSDILNYDIDLIQRAEFRVKFTAQTGGTCDSTTSIAFGLASARADAIDSIASHALFRIIGSNAIVVETDDAVTDRDDVATGVSFVSGVYRKFVIDFTGGKSDVKFYIDGVRVAASTVFTMASYTAGFQPYFQIQKTSDNNTDAFSVDYIKIVSKRA